MARKKKGLDEGQRGDPGVVLFTALMLILLSFFILMNSIAVIDAEKSRRAIGSLLSEFASLGGDQRDTGNSPDIDTGENPYIRIDEIQLVLDNEIRNLGLDGDAQAYLRGSDFVIELSGQLLTSEDPRRIPDAGKKIIATVADLLRKTRHEIRIEGHSAGGAPPQPQPELERHWQSSRQRAVAVAEHLAQTRIPPGQLTVAGYGATRPLVSNETPEGPRKNTRVEIVVVDGEHDELLLFTPREVKIGRWKFREIEYHGKKRYQKI